MRCTLLVSISLLSLSHVMGQGDLGRDLSIPLGYEDAYYYPHYLGLSSIDFRENTIDTVFLDPAPDINLGLDGGSYFNDFHGNLKLISNGCAIYNELQEKINEEDYLFPGTISNGYCDNGDFPLFGASIFLAADDLDSSVYFVASDFKIDQLPLVYSDTLGLWTLKKNPSGDFEVHSVEKLKTGKRSPGRLTATQADVEGEWWIATVGRVNNEIVTYRVGEQGFMDSVVNPLPLTIPISLTNETTFSPDGSRFTFAHNGGDVWLFDFDASDGTLSNFQIIEFSSIPPSNTRGIIFSPNSKLVYVTADTFLYQVELNTGISRQIGHHWSQAETGWPVGIGQMTMGPDCRIYVAPASTIWYVHVIHDPNEVGVACNFQARALRTSTRLYFSFPKTPHYRDGNDCLDIPWPFGTDTLNTIRKPGATAIEYLALGPNPGRGDLTVHWLRPPPAASAPQLLVHDVLGRLVAVITLNGQDGERLRWPAEPAGSYLWQLVVGERVVQHGRILRE